MAQRTGSAFETNINAQFPTNGTGTIGASRVRAHIGTDIKDSFLNILDHLIDEDNMASDSATKVPSQQSVKAYVDSATGSAQTVSRTITNGEMLALFDTPITLIAAPGAGKFIQVLDGYILHDSGGTAFSNTTTVVEYATGQDISASLTNFLNSTSDVMYNMPSGAAAIAAFSQFENSLVRYIAPSANPTTGNGTVKIFLRYKIMTV